MSRPSGPRDSGAGDAHELLLASDDELMASSSTSSGAAAGGLAAESPSNRANPVTHTAAASVALTGNDGDAADDAFDAVLSPPSPDRATAGGKAGAATATVTRATKPPAATALAPAAAKPRAVRPTSAAHQPAVGSKGKSSAVKQTVPKSTPVKTPAPKAARASSSTAPSLGTASHFARRTANATISPAPDDESTSSSSSSPTRGLAAGSATDRSLAARAARVRVKSATLTGDGAATASKPSALTAAAKSRGTLERRTSAPAASKSAAHQPAVAAAKSLVPTSTLGKPSTVNKPAPTPTRQPASKRSSGSDISLPGASTAFQRALVEGDDDDKMADVPVSSKAAAAQASLSAETAAPASLSKVVAIPAAASQQAAPPVAAMPTVPTCERCQSAEEDKQNPIVPCPVDGCLFGLHRFCFSRAVHPSFFTAAAAVHNYCTLHVDTATADAKNNINGMERIRNNMPQTFSLQQLRNMGAPATQVDSRGGNKQALQVRLPAPHCEEALRWNAAALGVIVDNSHIRGAGKGVYATRHFPKGALIGWWWGVSVTWADFEMMQTGPWRLDSVLGNCNYAEEDFSALPYAGIFTACKGGGRDKPTASAAGRAEKACKGTYEVKYKAVMSKETLDSAMRPHLLVSEQCPLLYANDPKGSEFAANMDMHVSTNAATPDLKVHSLVATKDIEEGDELLVSYGWDEPTWSHSRKLAKVYAAKCAVAPYWASFPTEMLHAWVTSFPESLPELPSGNGGYGSVSRTDRVGLIKWLVDWHDAGDTSEGFKLKDHLLPNFEEAARMLRRDESKRIDAPKKECNAFNRRALSGNHATWNCSDEFKVEGPGSEGRAPHWPLKASIFPGPAVQKLQCSRFSLLNTSQG
jgi:hypothetical protein